MYLRPRESVAQDGINHVPLSGAASAILGVSMTLACMATISIFLRLYGARTGTGLIRWDFWFILAGTVIGIVTQTFFTLACVNGVGWHVHDLTFDQLWQALRWTWVGIYVGLVGTFVGKLAIVALLYQVATRQQKRRKYFLVFIGGFNVVCGCIQLILSVTQCDPYYKLWYRLDPGTCNNIGLAAKYGYFQGTVAMLADLALAIYPITIVWNLQASLRTKIGFCALMAGGCLCAVAACVRTAYITRLRNPADPTWELVPFLAWASTEMWTIMLIGSVPPLRPLFLRWFGNTKSLITNSMTRSRNGGTRNGTITGGTLLGAGEGVPTPRNPSIVQVRRPSKVIMMALPDESQEQMVQKKKEESSIMVSNTYTITSEVEK